MVDMGRNRFMSGKLNGPAMRRLMSEYVGYEVTPEVTKEAGLRCGKRWADEGNEKFEGSIDSVLGQGQDGSWWGAGLMHDVADWRWRSPGIKISSILDHGCGIGASTLVLQKMLPDVWVVGSNLAGEQLEFARFLATKFDSKATFVDEASLSSAGVPFDAILGFELFEHFKEPMVEVSELLKAHRFTVMYEASSFNKPKLPGHFSSYIIDGVETSGRSTLRKFNMAMRKIGFVKSRYHYWNGRPRVFYRDDLHPGNGVDG